MRWPGPSGWRRRPSGWTSPKIGRLDFEAPDIERFPALGIGACGDRGGRRAPAVLNAANEVAVAAFLAGRIAFLEIVAITCETLARYDPPAPDSLDAVLAIDGEARAVAGRMMEVKAA